MDYRKWNFEFISYNDKGLLEFEIGLKKYGYISSKIFPPPKKELNKYWDPVRKIWVTAPPDKWTVNQLKGSEVSSLYSNLEFTYAVYRHILDQWNDLRSKYKDIYWQPSGLRWVQIKEKYPSIPAGHTEIGDTVNKVPAVKTSDGDSFVTNARYEQVKKELGELKRLYDEHIITNEQYDTQVKKILDDLY